MYMKMNCKLLYHCWSEGWWWLRGWCFPFFVDGSQGSFYRRGWKDGLFFSSSIEKSPWLLLQGHDETRLEMEVLCAPTDSQRGSIDWRSPASAPPCHDCCRVLLADWGPPGKPQHWCTWRMSCCCFSFHRSTLRAQETFEKVYVATTLPVGTKEGSF